MARIAVVGMGAWGAALALHACRCGHSVVAWQRNAERVALSLASKTLTVGAQDFTLPSSLQLTSAISDCTGADVTIVALPAKAWADVLPLLSADVIVSATKGLERASGLTPLSFAHQHIGLDRERLVVLSGPSFSSDLAAARPLSVVSASTSAPSATTVATLLNSNSTRIYTSDDPLGVELGGILKNVIAIAAGVSDALGYGPSARAGLITRGLAEMTRLATALGARAQTLSGLSGLGDLIMTATEDQSRNRMVGLRLGRGETLSEIVASLGSVAEGVTTAPLVKKLAVDANVDVPVTEHVIALLEGSLAAKQVALELMKRPLKSEF